MSWREWRKSRLQLESLRHAFLKNPSLGTTAKAKIIGIDFESFVRELEKSIQQSHTIAATSYFLAGLTALVSLIASFL